MRLLAGARGPDVVALQRKLMHLGFDLPRYRDDGELGDETLGALSKLLEQHGRKAANDPNPREVDDRELAFVESLAELLDATPSLELPAGCRDRRGSAALAALQRHIVHGTRPYIQVTGVTLHQTACWLSDSHDIARCDAIGAHMVVYPDGSWFWNHDVTTLIDHGNGLNTRTFGIEIDGNFEGWQGHPETLWKPGGRAGRITPAQVTTTLAIIAWQQREIARHGGKLVYCLPHRVASKDRQDDPGSEAWQLVGLEAIERFGLSCAEPGFTTADSFGGLPIPGAWMPDDPARAHIPY